MSAFGKKGNVGGLTPVARPAFGVARPMKGPPGVPVRVVIVTMDSHLASAAARAAGIAYVAIPITHSGFSEPQVHAMVEALSGAKGKVLAYCRSGTRSTLLWALAESAQGGDPDALTNIAAKAGYDLSPVRPLMDMLKARAG